jgi:hypothetical protein
MMSDTFNVGPGVRQDDTRGIRRNRVRRAFATITEVVVPNARHFVIADARRADDPQSILTLNARLRGSDVSLDAQNSMQPILLEFLFIELDAETRTGRQRQAPRGDIEACRCDGVFNLQRAHAFEPGQYGTR